VLRCVQLVNGTALPLQLGCVSGLAKEPLPLEVLGPGECVWLPLQVGCVVKSRGRILLRCTSLSGFELCAAGQQHCAAAAAELCWSNRRRAGPRRVFVAPAADETTLHPYGAAVR
jgi:hypothetical protein